MTANFIESSAELITETDILKKIEIIGRTCYKSEDKIKEGSAEKFVKNALEKKHYSILEHIPVYLTLMGDSLFEAWSKFLIMYDRIRWMQKKVPPKKPTFFTVEQPDGLEKYQRITWVVFDLRYLAEIADDIDDAAQVIFEDTPAIYFYQALCTALSRSDTFGFINPTWHGMSDNNKLIWHDIYITSYNAMSEKVNNYFKFYTVKLICDRGVSHELVRHRNCAFMQESTRYCDYSDVMNFILPSDLSVSEKSLMVTHCAETARRYSLLRGAGMSAEKARAILPNALATTLIITASIAEWRHILDLRLYDKAGIAHPQVKELMAKVEPLIPELERSK